MMKKRLSLIISLVAAIVLLGAASALFLMDREQPAAQKVIEAERSPLASPVTSDSEINALVDSNSAFAFDLYQALRETGGNLFYSPYSISLALAMTYAGARGETAAEMAHTLQFLLPQNSLHPAFNSLAIELAGLGKGTRIRDGESFRLNIVNAIWGQEDFRFQSGFLDVLAANYGAMLRLLDFAKVPEESRLTINDWISEQTENRIKDLIPQGVISRLTRLVLTNAIHFNAAWQFPFAEHETRDDIFYLLDGNEVTVPMMRQAKHLQFDEGKGYQAIELPYDGGEFSMVILLPDSGHFEEFEELLSVQKLGSIMDRLERHYITLTMPQFEFESDFSLKETLTAMGMPSAFSPENADFSGMTGGRELFIQDVIHKAVVSVDEAGTEAAAATAVVMIEALPQVAVNVDRPFIFFIRDIETGTILFVGRVLNPGA